MRTYLVKTVESIEDISKAEKLYVDQFKSGTPGAEPRTSAQLVFVRRKGFLCRMESMETDIRAEVTEANGPTHTDSCLEFFVNFNPDMDCGYLNLEGNPIGTLLCKYGKGRHDRRTLESLGCNIRPVSQAEQFEGGWAISYFIPLELIRAIFNRDSFSHGDILKANFYKCGDMTSHPHYGMWNLVDLENVDFHRPEFFGELIID